MAFTQTLKMLTQGWWWVECILSLVRREGGSLRHLFTAPPIVGLPASLSFWSRIPGRHHLSVAPAGMRRPGLVPCGSWPDRCLLRGRAASAPSVADLTDLSQRLRNLSVLITASAHTLNLFISNAEINPLQARPSEQSGTVASKRTKELTFLKPACKVCTTHLLTETSAAGPFPSRQVSLQQ